MNHSQALSLIRARDTEPPGRNLLTEVDLLRLVASQKLATDSKEAKGQFLTPASVAHLMAGMFEHLDKAEISLLDPGAGAGSLLAAFVAALCQRQGITHRLRIVAYEIDAVLIEYLQQTLLICSAECKLAGISLDFEIRQVDFIEDTVRILRPALFDQADTEAFSHAILNPPYAKINANSKARALLQSLGLETTNLYTGFMAAAALLLQPRGEMVSITPRSFCNGLYFRDFRRLFLETMSLRQVHLFESRLEAFRDDEVLQETVIVQAVKQKEQGEQEVRINTSSSAEDDLIMSHNLPYTDVVHPTDPEQFIRLLPDSLSQQIVEQMKQFSCSLNDLGLTVSTGRVVDFRAKDYLRA
ncbi:MAG TPA: N-6 DNA methylase, partial [Allocoleopsis sp.]